jgi:hypothetical protein
VVPTTFKISNLLIFSISLSLPPFLPPSLPPSPSLSLSISEEIYGYGI